MLGLLALGLALGMYISYFLCRFHLRLVVNSKPVSSGIWALVLLMTKNMSSNVRASSMGLRNMIKSAVNLFTLVAESKHHIGTDECILEPSFWQPTKQFYFCFVTIITYQFIIQ